MIQPQRLTDTFMEIVRIDSESRNEKKMARHLEKKLTAMGAKIRFDNADKAVGGNASNLLAWFPGNTPAPPLLLNAHMDTVSPGNGIEPVLENGIFRSKGDTILGADDKSAVAILLEAMTAALENNLPLPPVEMLFTVCEEIGLAGARQFDTDLLQSRFGYALDASGMDLIVTRAPGADRLTITLTGKEAHAGVAPEKGINAILLAARAVASLEPGRDLGRIDGETTSNIGVIQGGLATNIVPKTVVVKGEARSHDVRKLEALSRRMATAFENTVQDARTALGITADDEPPLLEIKLEREFSPTHLPDDHPAVLLAMTAARNLGRTLTPETTGGGADANIFFEKGLPVAVLGTGMQDMHTIKEHIALSDMVKTAELTLEILRLHAGGLLDKPGAGQ
ncbi:MAG: peptidase T [Desulfobacterales bacterium]|nr:MAG: peptidase T [Desulfobacterales bacterium]